MKRDLSWCFQPAAIRLDRGEVHIWRASPSLPEDHLSQLAQALSKHERLRAESFRSERDRMRFIVGWGVLRSVLGQYLCIEPSRLHFRYSPFGKPYLVEQPEGDVLQFSLAHSHELNIYAFCRNQEIGVDLEYVRSLPDSEQIAARFFSARENSAWLGLPAEQRQEAFYVCWTRKEACAKALGCGLLQLVSSFVVTSVLEETARILSVGDDPMKATSFCLETLIPTPGYIAALALARGEYSLSCYQWAFTSESTSTASLNRPSHLPP